MCMEDAVGGGGGGPVVGILCNRLRRCGRVAGYRSSMLSWPSLWLSRWSRSSSSSSSLLSSPATSRPSL